MTLASRQSGWFLTRSSLMAFHSASVNFFVSAFCGSCTGLDAAVGSVAGVDPTVLVQRYIVSRETPVSAVGTNSRVWERRQVQELEVQEPEHQ